MATNIYFNNFNSVKEQTLYEQLIIESIKMYGVGCIYIPRKINNEDQVFKEDEISTYEDSFKFELYVKNIEGFNGQGDFLSKFNLEIRDQITFTMARRTFANNVSRYNGAIRPFEGDLIYFPFNKKLFVIRFVEHEDVFYAFGKLMVWDAKCELFEYSGEVFNTNISEIDCIAGKLSDSLTNYAITDSDGNILTDSEGFGIIRDHNEDIPNPLSQNDIFTEEGNEIINWDETNPFSEGF